MSTTKNPCIMNAFEAYALSPDETDVKTILRVLKDRRADWKHRSGKVQTAAGADWEVSEAELNRFEKELLDPLARLRLERFTHRRRAFQRDGEIEALAESLGSLEPETVTLPQQVLDRVRQGIAAKLTPLIPDPSPGQVEDSLPWPERPGPMALAIDDIGQAIGLEIKDGTA